jgi:hypothetical protein
VYGKERGKGCVLDIDMELHSVMAWKVLCTYVDTVCVVIYIYNVFISVSFVINVISYILFPYIYDIYHKY